MKIARFVLTFAVILMGAAVSNAHKGSQNTSGPKNARLLTVQYDASLAGRWMSSNINHAYEYEFDNEGNYVFQKVAIANGARIVLNGRGTYQLSGTVLYCHQTEVTFAGRPAQAQDESWSFNPGRGTLARDGIVLTR